MSSGDIDADIKKILDRLTAIEARLDDLESDDDDDQTEDPAADADKPAPAA